MTRTTQSAAFWILITIAVFATIIGLTFIAGHYANGQGTPTTETTTTLEPATVEPAIAVDPSTVIATTGVLGAGTAIVNSILNQRKQNKNVKGTDMDVFTFIRITNRIWATWSKHKEMTVDQVLDMPMTDDPKDLDQTTFREALAREERQWREFIDQEYLYKK